MSPEGTAPNLSGPLGEREKGVRLESCQFPGWRLGLVTGVVGRVPGGPERLAGCPLVPGHSLLSPARSHAGLGSLRPGGGRLAAAPSRALAPPGPRPRAWRGLERRGIPALPPHPDSSGLRGTEADPGGHSPGPLPVCSILPHVGCMQPWSRDPPQPLHCAVHGVCLG